MFLNFISFKFIFAFSTIVNWVASKFFQRTRYNIPYPMYIKQLQASYGRVSIPQRSPASGASTSWWNKFQLLLFRNLFNLLIIGNATSQLMNLWFLYLIQVIGFAERGQPKPSRLAHVHNHVSCLDWHFMLGFSNRSDNHLYAIHLWAHLVPYVAHDTVVAENFDSQSVSRNLKKRSKNKQNLFENSGSSIEFSFSIRFESIRFQLCSFPNWKCWFLFRLRFRSGMAKTETRTEEPQV